MNTQSPRLLGKHPNKAKRRKPSILIFGEPGVGKTWGCLDFPDVYYIDCEGGATLPHYTQRIADVDGLYVGPEDGANDFQTVVSQVQALATTQHDRKTLVIDSFSKLFNTAVQIEYDVLEKKMDMTKSFSAERKPAVAATRKIVAWLDRLDMNTIFVCHQKTDWKNGEAIGHTFDGWDKLGYELNLVLQILKRGGKRLAKVVKSRMEEFPEATTFPWSYHEFATRHGLEVIEEKPETLSPASPAQINEFAHLTATLKTDAGILAKWYDKAGVEDFSEMDSHTIQKCVDFLKAQLPT